MPECYIIAGSNGAGKTTFAREFLPRHVQCLDFINPDMIAAGLSPFDAGRAMVRAGRLVLEEIDGRLRRGDDFGFETTLAGRAYVKRIQCARSLGYHVHVFYLWIPSADLALRRIRDRVEIGGHDVPEADVRRRFIRTLQNLFSLYRPHLDSLHFFDNSTSKHSLVSRDELGTLTVFDQALYDQILAKAGGRP